MMIQQFKAAGLLILMMIACYTPKITICVVLCILPYLVLSKFKRKRLTISLKHRRIVFDTCRGLCIYCGTKLIFERNDPGRVATRKGAWQIEHLISHSAGGSDALENLATACIACNQMRANTMQKFGKHNVQAWMVQRLGYEKCLKFIKDSDGHVYRCGRRVYHLIGSTCFQTHIHTPSFDNK